MSTVSPARSNQPPLTPSSARGSAMRQRSSMSNAPPSARSSYRDPQLSARRAGYSSAQDGPHASVPRSQRGGMDMETPTRSRAGALSSARRSTLDLMQTQGNAMKVYVRVRPFSQRELAQANMSPHSTIRIDAENPAMITILDPNKDFRPLVTHKFTRCFWSVFERTNENVQQDRIMGEMRDTVDTYLNGGMNSARRARTPSMVSRSGEPVVPAYVGAGSNAAMAESNISHPPYASQAEVYAHVGKPVLANTLEGYNGCVFAYGQTGSGKTFTMMGYAPAPAEFRRRRESLASARGVAEDRSGPTSARSPRADAASFECDESMQVLPVEWDDGEDVVDNAGVDPVELMGIIPRISADLFAGLRAKREKDASWSYRVEVTYYEIYNEKVYDLIKPARSADLKVRNHPTTGPYVDGLASKVCNKEEDVIRVIRNGMQERHTAATTFNDRSSRSHAILSFNLLQLALDGSDNTLKMQSKLNLVDLAGSERAGAAGADRPEFSEGVKINLSLTVLGRVIDCLSDLSQNKSLAVPVPYRDSTLTLLLMDSIGGNSQTSMVATVSPHMINFEEAKQTLRYASRATVIVNRAVINEDPQMRQIKLLTGEVERLQQLLKESGGCDYTNEDIRAMEKKIKMLEKRVAEQERIIAGLRAELERAGIADPTLDDSFAEGSLLKSAADRKKDEQMLKKFDAMQAELSTVKAELERRSKGDADEVAKLKKKVQEQEKQVRQLELKSQAARQRATLFGDRTMSNLENVFSIIQEKEDSFFQCCWAMMLNSNSEAGVTVTRMQRENEQRLSELRNEHEDALREQEERYQKRLKELQAEHTAQQHGLIQKHKDALAAIEEHMQRNRDIHEEDRRRLEADKEQLRRQMADVAAKAREAYQQDLEKLRRKLEAEAGDRRGGEASRLQQEQHDREVERLNDEVERVKKAKEAEIARLRKQLESEQLRREGDLMEKDRQRRQVENELSAARKELLALNSEKNKGDKGYEDQIRDLVRQQEELINISNSVLGDWENKSADMEGQMCKLRALIYDKDYINFRQKMRELAFSERSDISRELTAAEEKKRRRAEALRSIQERMRKTVQEQSDTFDRIQQEVLANRPISPAPTSRSVESAAPSSVGASSDDKAAPSPAAAGKASEPAQAASATSATKAGRGSESRGKSTGGASASNGVRSSNESQCSLNEASSSAPAKAPRRAARPNA